MTNLKLFLDLEETIITNWADGELTNLMAIHDWINRMFETDEVEIRIFSFAIWSAKDKDHFVKSGMKSVIENALDVKIVEWLSVEEMQHLVEEWSGMRFIDQTDFVQMNGKHGAFEKICLLREKDCHCVLIDDAIPHRTIEDHTRNLTIELLPVQIVLDKPLQDVQRKL